MIRARFETESEDPRPVSWPIKHPYWITGYTGEDNERSVIVAYADDEAEILRLWPEAEDIETTEVDGYRFSSRFPRPEWFREEAKP